jgi:hypothetical protein
MKLIPLSVEITDPRDSERMSKAPATSHGVVADHLVAGHETLRLGHGLLEVAVLIGAAR